MATPLTRSNVPIPLYVSVATEVRDLTMPPQDGVPGESWEARTGTTFLWLEDGDAAPPRNEAGVLGAAPNEPKVLLLPQA